MRLYWHGVHSLSKSWKCGDEKPSNPTEGFTNPRKTGLMEITMFGHKKG
ncbi:MAG: hypothetical protein KIH08_08575 [Candidatus Freyarchaeota archaeon]|nr:hypothetical protein [Candidatus Jordarchaeia archaeon]MBS7270599.1 hypothetical protein [Candidatus Jordarchaeia archaeon]MBS7280526.1 hypothetical protein [Candidatus Jordarchaeia archaeon]